MTLSIDQYYLSERPHPRSVGPGILIWLKTSDVSGTIQASDGDEWFNVAAPSYSVFSAGMTMDDTPTPAAPGADKMIVYPRDDILYFRSGAAGAETALIDAAATQTIAGTKSFTGPLNAAGGTTVDPTFGGNRGGLKVYSDGSVGIAGAGQNSTNVFTVYYRDTSIGVHSALMEIDVASVVPSWDTAAVKMVSRSGQSQGKPIAGIVGNQLTTLDLEGIWGTNDTVIARPVEEGGGNYPTGTIATSTGGGRHTISVGLATQHARYSAVGTYADEANGLYITSQGTGKFHASSPNPNGVRGNAAIYCHGPQGWEWFLYYVGTSGDKANPLLAVNQYGQIGSGQIPTAGLSIKQKTDDAGGGVSLIQNGFGSTSTAFYTGGDGISYMKNSAGCYIGLGDETPSPALEVAGMTSLSGQLLKLGVQGAGEMLSVTAAGVINIVNTANFGTGAAGAAATNGNVSTDAATGPTTAAATTWVKIQVNGSVRWLRAWS